MKIKQGNLPTNVIYYARKPEVVSFNWDDDDESEAEAVATVRPVYISDADNKTTQNTGKCWAGKDAQVITRDNIPLDICIINLEHRGNGGRAYKCIVDDYYCDLREDVLIDTIRNCNIKRGVPACKFVWGKVKSEMKLVRVGSALHTALLEANELNALTTVATNALKVGDKMQSKNGQVGIFLGFCDNIRGVVNHPDCRNHYVYGNVRSDRSHLANLIPQSRIMCWFECDADEANKSFNALFNVPIDVQPGYTFDRGLYHIKFKKSHSYKVKLGTTEVPKDVFEQIHRRAVQDCWSHKNNDRKLPLEIKRSSVSENFEKLTVRASGAPVRNLPAGFNLTIGDEWDRYKG